MANVQQADLIEFVSPQALKPHPLNVAIYGDDDYHELVDSIKELGVLQALYVTSKNVILSGHRRWRAAMAAGSPNIPVIRMSYTNDLDERQAIIEHNRYRTKNGQQLSNEGNELERIERKKAEQRQRATLPQKGQQGFQPYVSDNSHTHEIGRSSDFIAQTIGLGSGRQWDRLKDVAEKAPDLLPDIKPHGLSISGAYSQLRKRERAAKVEAQKEAIKNLKPPTEPIWNVIVIDPPWPIAGGYDPQGRRAANPYPTMSIEDIRAITLPATDDCVLWLWVTNLNMHDGLHILEHWGFELRNIMTWAKPSFGIGRWLRGQTEHCLLATRGNPLFTAESASTLLQAARTEHSAKPDAFYVMVEQVCHGRKLDYFSRKHRDGWDSYGDEAQP